jgi:hypothetical protein
VIGRGLKGADPVLGRTCSGIAYQAGSGGRSGDERVEGLERERWDAIFDLQCDQPGPGDAKVKAVVGLATWDIGEVVSWPRSEAYVPVFCSGNLWRVRLVSTDQPPKQLACLARNAHCKYEMPDHWHSVSAQDEPLNITQVERVLRRLLTCVNLFLDMCS